MCIFEKPTDYFVHLNTFTQSAHICWNKYLIFPSYSPGGEKLNN